jgi:SAM-dependent methyltransferase
MPTLDWLKSEFKYGYDSGNVLSRIPGRVRFNEERAAGGSYRKLFLQAAVPYLRKDSRVLELGPGRGSWSRALLEFIPDGELHTVDFQDVTQWLKPKRYGGRLICHRVSDNSFSGLPDLYFDFFWSFGVLCHNEIASIRDSLSNARRKLKPQAYAVHQYGDWEKLERFGWAKGRVPVEFKDKPDSEIWWPRNSQASMIAAAEAAGWEVVTADLDLVRRDSIILLRNPGSQG